MRRYLSFFLVVAVVSVQAEVPTFKPGFNLFSKEQDIQLGREAAAQVERQMQVVHDPTLEGVVQRIGRQLSSNPKAGGFPYSFKVINDKSINAFALPGGPTFVQTGLLSAIDNEAQLAGVMAHEISHVALRHGTHQASKANLLQLPAMLAGAVMGGSLLGQLAQVGVGLGFNSLLLKYSRDAEKQADLLGAQLMADAGYNPLELARFFEKLQSQGGARTSTFFSDHPDPGDRERYIEAEIRQMPQRNYSDGDPRELQTIQSHLTNLPAAQQGMRSRYAGPVSQGDPNPNSQFREYRNQAFSISYPSNWEVFGDRGGSAVTIAPRSGLVQDQGGNVAVGYGLMVSFYTAHGNYNRPNLRDDTYDLVGSLQQTNPALQATGGQRQARVNGQPALVTTLSNQSPMGGRETDMLVTVNHPQGLLYLIFISPANEFSKVQGVYEQMLSSMRF